MGGSPSEQAIRCVSERKQQQSFDAVAMKTRDLASSYLVVEADDAFSEMRLSWREIDAERALIRDYEAEDTIRKQNDGKKHVSFSNVEIRSYERVIGDHPCCKMGCPLSLGWEYKQETTKSLDRYEAMRSPRRSREDMHTSMEERRRMLSEEGGVSEGDMRRAERKLHRARSCNAKVCERMSASFFHEPKVLFS